MISHPHTQEASTRLQGECPCGPDLGQIKRSVSSPALIAAKTDPLAVHFLSIFCIVLLSSKPSLAALSLRITYFEFCSDTASMSSPLNAVCDTLLRLQPVCVPSASAVTDVFHLVCFRLRCAGRRMSKRVSSSA